MKIWEMRCSGDYDYRFNNDDNRQISICSADESHRASLRDWSVRSSIEVISEVPDFMTYTSEEVVTKRVQDAFIEKGITGVEYVKVDCVKLSDGGYEDVPYIELKTIGWGGVGKGIEILKRCPECGHTWIADFDKSTLGFDENAWDGSDFFKIWGLGDFVSDRVKKLIEEKGFTGFRFESLDEVIDWLVEQPQGLQKRGQPGLRHWFTKEKASTLKGVELVW